MFDRSERLRASGSVRKSTKRSKYRSNRSRDRCERSKDSSERSRPSWAFWSVLSVPTEKAVVMRSKVKNTNFIVFDFWVRSKKIDEKLKSKFSYLYKQTHERHLLLNAPELHRTTLSLSFVTFKTRGRKKKEKFRGKRKVIFPDYMIPHFEVSQIWLLNDD